MASTTSVVPRIRAPRTHVPATTRRLALAGGTAIATALLAAALVRLLAAGLVEVDPGFEPLRWMPVLAATLFAAISATLTYAALDRATDRPVRNFLGAATLLLAASIVPIAVVTPDLGATTVLQGVLVALHVVVAVAIVVPLLRFAAPRTAA